MKQKLIGILSLAAALLLVENVFAVATESESFSRAPVEWADERPGTSTECGTRFETFDWSYCIVRTQGSQNSDVVYYLHGAFGSKESWQNNLKEVYDEFSRRGEDPPTIVSFSMGRLWFLTVYDPDPMQGTAEFLMKRMIPTVEGLLGGLKGRRILSGASMGGFNASLLGVKYPDQFDLVLAICPAVADIERGFFGFKGTDYAQKSGAKVTHALAYARALDLFYMTNRDWQTASPLILLRKREKGGLPPFYVSCGDKDELGFFTGSQELQRLLLKKSQEEVTFVPLKGGHCVTDSVSAVNFILKKR